MAKKISPIIPLAAAGIGVALLLRGSKGSGSAKNVLSESERGEILAGLPESAAIEYEDGQVILGEHFVEDSLIPFLGASTWAGRTTGALAFIDQATFRDIDGDTVRPLKDLAAIDPEAYEELKDAIIAISKVHYEHMKSAKAEDKPLPYGTMAQRVKAIAQEQSSLTKFMIAQIERLKAEQAG